jgi:RNA polymerase sigma-70 factor (ECF subfamily)
MHQIATDADLIAASIDDAQLFTRVFDRHYVEIHAFVQRRLGVRLADRIATRTFVEAFRARRHYAPAGPDARPWLYGIAVRMIARYHRRERRMLRRYARRGPSLLAEPPLAARESSAPHATRRRVARAIARLDGPLRDALLLEAWAGLTRDEAAKALGCDAGEVGRRLTAARQRLAAAADFAAHPAPTPSGVRRAG